MAKAEEIRGLDCAADAIDWIKKVFRVRFQEILDLREAALDFSDIAGVHDMRVATRRLRSAIRDFSPFLDKHALKHVKKDLKDVADALGAVRDQDVAIIALEKRQKKAKTEQVKDGIGTLLRERRGLREIARLDLSEILTPDNFKELEERFSSAADKAISSKESNQTISFNQAGRQLIKQGLDDLLKLGDNIYKPFDDKKLHKMRIAAKRLRYAIELFTDCRDEKTTPFAKEIAELQSRLGKVHDCDVWIKNISKRLRKELENQLSDERNYQAATWLLSKFIKKRAKEYRSALKLWSKWQTDNFAGRMQAIIS